MNRLIYKVLRKVVPEWMLDDWRHRWTHPYWRRREVPLPERNRAATIGLGDKRELTSTRRPFKYVNQQRILAMLRAEGAKRLLDVGCGTGNLVRHLDALGFEAHGVTINPEEIAQAGHERIYLADIQTDLAGTPLAGAQFDALLSFDCLEHLEWPMAALRNINRLLRPDGLFISYIPPVRWIECDYHVIVYTPRQFRWLLNLSGFDLEHKEGRYRFSSNGVTYYARKKYADRMVYPAVRD